MATQRFYGNSLPGLCSKKGQQLTPQQLRGDTSDPHIERCVHHGRACLQWLGLITLLCLGSGRFEAARAWNDFGHRVVAAVAWQHLTPMARAQASALLRLNPDYPRWVAGVAPEQQDSIAFLSAATWPDDIKREAGYLNDGERPQSPDADQNSDYQDLAEHRYWHYVDVPFSADGTALPATPAPNAATRIEDFRKVLADPRAAPSMRSYDLAWLLHLVGDIHQPLHAVSRFTQELPEGDLGGNRIRLCAAPCRLTLHYFWDAALGYGTLSEAQALARQLPTPPARRIADTRVQDWLNESSRIARRVVYQAPIGPGSGPYPLTPRYREQARVIARSQVALAGRRLAVLLNTALAGGF
jgi:S1/P1 Nuclease